MSLEGFNEEKKEPNEGKLEEHPRYEELVNKWGLVALNKRPPNDFGYLYNGKISSHGYLEDIEGNETQKRVHDLLTERELLMVYWAMRDELYEAEGFIDTTDWTK